MGCISRAITRTLLISPQFRLQADVQDAHVAESGLLKRDPGPRAQRPLREQPK